MIPLAGTQDDRKKDRDHGRVVDERRERRDDQRREHEKCDLARRPVQQQAVTQKADHTTGLQTGAEQKHAGHGDRGLVAESRERLRRLDDAKQDQRPEHDQRHEIGTQPLGDEQHGGDDDEGQYE